MSHLDPVYEDAFFADTYDDFNPWSASDDLCLSMAHEAGGSILDLGCGTGMLARRLAADGLTVVGADPSEQMLRVARSRPGAERVTWVQSDGQSLDLPQRFDLIYMTGHAFQALLTDDDAVALLRTAGAHLAADGRFVLETRNPAVRAWESWTPGQTRTVVQSSIHGPIESYDETVADERSGIVALTGHCRLLRTGEERIGHGHLRFIEWAHLDDLLVRAGLTPIAWYGDWDRGPLLPDSKEIIAVTRRSDG